MADVIQYGPKAWQRQCSRCNSRFRYALEDIRDKRIFGLSFGLEVACPVCGFACLMEAEHSRCADHRDARAPSYGELLSELRWFVNTAENAAEMISEDGLDVDAEETGEVRERIAEAKEMIKRADARIGVGR